jgi:hypothetical protein
LADECLQGDILETIGNLITRKDLERQDQVSNTKRFEMKDIYDAYSKFDHSGTVEGKYRAWIA